MIPNAFRSLICLFCLMILFVGECLAGVEPYENFIKGQIRKNDSLQVKDEKFKNPQFNWADITNISVQNAVSLTILDEQVIDRSFSCKLSLKIEYFSDPGQTKATLIDSINLNVNYNKEAGAIYKDKDVYKFANGYYVKVTVIDISSPEYGSEMPPVLQLSSQIVIDRKYAFKPFLPVELNGELSGSGENAGLRKLSSGSTSGNHLSLTWAGAIGDEEFDVEWVTIDNGSEWSSLAAAMANNSTTASDAQIGQMFRNNATRITTTEHSYLISLIYNANYIAVRMRQAHYVDGIRNTGDWFYKTESPNVYAIWALPWHEENLNWQYSASYAEEGKKKEVVSYFDGSLRGRQTVTLSNSGTDVVSNDQTVAVVQENIYDQFGRAAASILPAPVKEAGVPGLHYFHNFNKNSRDSSYNFIDLNAANCEPHPGLLSTTSGASRYYSGNNDFKAQRLYNMYIPDAQGYPLSVTQYTADNTGRIKIQGGVGPVFQPGTQGQSHTTKYFYGKPEQWELDRLFGNDIGSAEHYLKNMVVDPNGQISVSYLNSAGKTIATALTGSSTDNVEALSTIAGEKYRKTRILKPEQFSFDGSSLKLSATTTYMAAVTGVDTLRYSVGKLISRYGEGTFKPCSNCFYNLTITVTDDCGNPVPFNKTMPVKIGSETANCNDNGLFEETLILPFTAIGSYYITFEFALDKNVIERFTDTYIEGGKQAGVIKKKQAFILNYFNETNFIDCFADCKTARSKLGTLAAFTAMFKSKLTDLGEDPELYSSYIAGLYASLSGAVTAIEAACMSAPVSPCEIYRVPMLADVSPGGQYALMDSLGNFIEPETNVITNKFRNGVFNVNASTDPFYSVTKDDGSITSPFEASFTIEDLKKYWRPEWAELFLPSHPEYCKLLFCNNNTASMNWDEKLRNTDLASAIPSVAGSVTFSNTLSTWLLPADPFFNGGPGAGYLSAMTADLNNYSTNVLGLNAGAAVVKGLSKFVDYQLYCADSTATTYQTTSDRWTNCNPKVDCRIPDREWQLYRDMYLELKQKYFEEVRRLTTCSLQCEVGTPISLPATGGGSSSCGNELNLGETGLQLSEYKFSNEDVNYKFTYWLVKGMPGQSPNPPLDICGNYNGPIYYPCLKVYLANGSSRSFYNVWMFTCSEALEICHNPGWVYVDGQLGYNKFYINDLFTPDYRHEYTIFEGYSSTSPPIFNYCSSHSDYYFYDCFTVYHDNGLSSVYNNVWVLACFNVYAGPGLRNSYPNSVQPTEARISARQQIIKDNNFIESDKKANEIIIADVSSFRIYSILNADTSLLSPETKNKVSVSKEKFSKYEFKPYFTVQIEHKYFRRLTNVWVATYINQKSLKADSGVLMSKGLVSQQALLVSCPPLLATKASRFISVNRPAPVSNIDPLEAYNNAESQLHDSIASFCETNADMWMKRLDTGLVGKSTAQIALLRSKLIELCTMGGDVTHPFGASSLPSGAILVNSIACRNFGEVIKAALGSGTTFNNHLNPWLIESPYPYAPVQQATEKLIGNTSNELCIKLGQLRPAGSSNQQFYDYLKSDYGAAMSLSFADFEILLKGCDNCKFLLKKEILLPQFLIPGSKGCISRSEYVNAMDSLSFHFSSAPNASWSNYKTIVTNYLNFKWGFTFSYDQYKDFSDSTNRVKLCNEPPYTSLHEDPYACIKTAIEVAVGQGTREYLIYIEEERDEFRKAYVSDCSAAKPSVDLTAKERIYHYTLYYYDLAGNLIRTVSPEGVNPLSDIETALVDKSREFNPDACTYNGLTANSDKTTALQSLSGTLAYTGNAAVEMWLYQNDNSARQMIATTPDLKYMFQACINNNLLSIDVYSLRQDDPTSVSLILSNHVTANISAILPVVPWTHIVVQGANLTSGTLELWINGKLYPAVTGAPGAGCSWTVNSLPTLQMPENISTLKHLRLYNGRLMTANEIKENAESGCFRIFNFSNLSAYRFNVPAPGSITLAEGSTVETQFNPAYPSHGLTTTYAYNSTNQVIRQSSPDGGTSRFWYDELSRLVISQNAKQALLNKYSYTDYDALGRITEVGEKTVVNGTLTAPVQQAAPGYLTNSFYRNFLLTGTDSELTQTVYDQSAAGPGIDGSVVQSHLRKRVSAAIYRPLRNSAAINASYYSYDLSGNVKTLYQQIAGLPGTKKLSYEYDLVSGKVNLLAYQHGAHDRFYYRYKYDAENRLTGAYSSTTANIDPYGFRSTINEGDLRLDAEYQYYLHGPLARMELGSASKKVQGLDYVYTLQGWLKGVNGNKLSGAGADVGNDNASIAKDALAYSLGYYSGDYLPVGGSGSSAFAMNYQSASGDPAGLSLYNGNISSSTYAIANVQSGNTVGYTYKYDQLNRLKKLRQHNLSSVSGTWNNGSVNTNHYSEEFDYDGNGNILALKRNAAGATMDQLAYGYNRSGEGKLLNNKLSVLSDGIGGSAHTGELTGTTNYSYDAIGNLITDSKEGITGIDWTVYGKIGKVTKTNAAENITYGYDPTGNRVSKTINGISTWYVRDAQGNSLAVYDNKSGGTNWREQQLYGSSRLGMWKPNFNLASDSAGIKWNYTGLKFFELSNHLGNVMSVINDNRTLTGGVYSPTVMNAQDYYAFGSVMPGREYALSSSSAYRYGFNGKENDNEVKGTGNQQDYGMRIYDPRIAKFLSVDPIAHQYAYLSSYQFAGNTPIQAIDLDGLEPYKNAYKFAFKSDPLQNLFHADNVVNMANAKSPTSFNSLGWARQKNYFWDNYKNTPLGKEALSESNLAIIKAKGTPIVDNQWNGVMKQFGNDGVIDEVIHHHHSNKGANAIPVPKSQHIGADAEEAMHSMGKRLGKVSQVFGKNVNKASILLNVSSLFMDSPNSMLYTYHLMGTGSENRAYPTNNDSAPAPYYEWKWTGNPGESDREITFFNDYKKVDGKWRGQNQVGEKRTYNNEGKETKML